MIRTTTHDGRIYCVIAIAASLSLTHHATAVDIPIVNASFENNPVAMGCFAVFFPNGWLVHDPENIVDQNFDVVGGIHPEGGPYFTDPTPQGAHAAIIFLGTDIGGGPVGLRQELSAVLEPHVTYTLQVHVGNIASGQGPPPCDVFGFFDLDGFPGYAVQLLAGGEIIAEDFNTLAGTIPEGGWRLSTTQIAIPANDHRIDQTLEVRVINLNMIDTPMDPGIEVDFDNVRLSTSCETTGDVNGDTLVNGADIEPFVGVLLGNVTDPLAIMAADMDCSGTVAVVDVPLFIERLTM